MLKKSTVCLMMFVFANFANAQDFRALYSCSSGSEGKPITYAFNSRYMIRDNALATPFEIAANFKDGELLYTGFLEGERFKQWDDIFGFTDKAMKRWSATFANPLYIFDKVDTKKEYILRKALNCTLNNGVVSHQNNNLNYDMVKKQDKTIIDFGHADTCEKSIEFASNSGIENIVDYYREVNFKKLIMQEGAIKKSLVVINTKKGEIWESFVGSKTSPKFQKCSIISVDVPKIVPPAEKMFKDDV
jgi:hypothetical protein